MNNIAWLNHIKLLRKYLIQYFVVFISILFIAFYFSRDLFHLLANPLLAYLPKNSQLIATDITAPLFVPFKLAVITALLISIPFLFFQLWRFIIPGLYTKERKIILPCVLFSSLLFFLGDVFCYFLIAPILLKFFIDIAPKDVTIMTDIASYLGFMLQLFLIFGFMFQIPLLIYIITTFSKTAYFQLQAWRRYIIVLAFIVGMLVGPPDFLSQTFIALPIWFLYEIGMLFARYFALSEGVNVVRKNLRSSSRDY